MTILPVLRWAVPLALTLFLVQGHEASRTVDVAVAGDGALFLLKMSGTSLRVDVQRGQAGPATTFALSILPEGETLVEGRVVPWSVAGGSDAALVVMVLERAGGHVYRFVMNPFEREASTSFLSEPLFESEGEPWRIVEVRATGSTADGLEITFRRGQVTEKGVSPDYEERVYIDSCTPAGIAGSKLFDVRSGELIR